jgi:hypothetical protein
MGRRFNPLWDVHGGGLLFGRLGFQAVTSEAPNLYSDTNRVATVSAA